MCPEEIMRIADMHTHTHSLLHWHVVAPAAAIPRTFAHKHLPASLLNVDVSNPALLSRVRHSCAVSLQVEVDRAVFDAFPREFTSLPGFSSLKGEGLIVTARGKADEP